MPPGSRCYGRSLGSLCERSTRTRPIGLTLGNGLWERNYDSIAAVNQLIEIGGKRHNRQVSARAGVAGARAGFFDARQLLDQGVTKAYIAAVLAGENAWILNESAGFFAMKRIWRK